MTKDTFDKMMGIFAYDTGCVDSGIHDVLLKNEIKKQLHEEGASLEVLSRHIRNEFLSEEALAQGYSIEDVCSLIKWLDHEMDFSI